MPRLLSVWLSFKRLIPPSTIRQAPARGNRATARSTKTVKREFSFRQESERLHHRVTRSR
jgi:hypothetical protein